MSERESCQSDMGWLFGFPSTDSLDPLVNNQTKIVDDLCVETRICYIDREQKVENSDKAKENLRFRFMVEEVRQEQEVVIVELSSKEDLFFGFLHTMDALKFREVQKKFGLKCDFDFYLQFILSLFREIQGSRSRFDFVFLLKEETAELNIYAQSDLKKVFLIALDFQPIKDVKKKSSVSFKYNLMNAQVEIIEKRLINSMEVVK